MRFILNKVTNSNIRLGQICDFPRLPGKLAHTPLLLLYTRGGSIPHITHEVLQYLSKEQQCILINLPSSIQTFDSLQEYPAGIAKFCGLEECITFCSVQDAGVRTLQGYNSKKEISVWSYAGRVPLTPDKYMKIMEAFKPDIYEILSDSDTDMESSEKRCRKSVNVSCDMFDTCIEKHQSSMVLKDRGVLASIVGGHNIQCRRHSANHVSNHPSVSGFIINGLHSNGPEVLQADFIKIKHTLHETLKCLPEDKMRMVGGCWHPHHMVQLVEMGIDAFDSSLPYLVTQNKSALIFNYKSLNVEDAALEVEVKPDDNYQMSMNHDKFADDFTPIMKDCCCLTCRKHTRAYIYHLISVKELLASVLLMIHNLHHCIEFFKFIRKAGDENKKVIICSSDGAH